MKTQFNIRRRLLTAVAFTAFMTGSAAAQDLDVAWGTSSMGGLSYVVGAASANVLGKYVKDARFTALVSSGSTENVRRIQAGEFHCGQPTSDSAYFGYNGQREFTEPLSKLRFITNQWISPENVVVPKDSPVKSLADLKGRTITSTPGWGASIFAPALLEAAGLSTEDYTMVTLSASDGADSFRDGRVDAAMWAFGVPTATVSELAGGRTGVRFIPVDPEVQKVIEEKHPYWFVSAIPKGSYPGVDEDVPSLANNNVLLCSADLPDDLVYQMTKVLYEQAAEIREAVPAAQALGTPAAAEAPPIPMHPGAERYYREIGLVK